MSKIKEFRSICGDQMTMNLPWDNEVKIRFILNINNEHNKHTQEKSCPGETFVFCSDGEKLPQQQVTSKLPQGTKKLT